jgi:fructosamine-3-kinase
MFWGVQFFDKIINGAPVELDTAVASIITFVIPHLLDRLDGSSGGITLCYLHRDLWGGNIRRDVCTERYIFFDSNGFYGHNEADLVFLENKTSCDARSRILL